MDSNEIFKVKIKLKRIFYPKGVSTVKSGEFAIFVGEILDADKLTNFGFIRDIKLKGLVCNLDSKSEYNISCRICDENKYGTTYEILHMSRAIDTDNIDGQKEFLKIILSENIVDELLKQYKNTQTIINILEKEETDKLLEVKGIGEYRANKIIKEYKDQKKYEIIYSNLSHLQLSPIMINKLLEYYGTPEKVIKVVNEDIYSIVKIKGVGFKKADEIALKNGMSLNDFRRIKGFIYYYLDEQAEIGKSYIGYIELTKAINDYLGAVDIEEFNKAINKMIDNQEILISNDGNQIALMKMYNLEMNIYKELNRLNISKKEISQNDIGKVENAIKLSEKLQGFEFTEEQKKAIKQSVYHNVIAITGGAGCVDADTEFLSEFG